jgi:hypothetical protein
LEPALIFRDDIEAKAAVATLLRELDLEPVDAGPLSSARFIEPCGMLQVQLAYSMGVVAHIGVKLLRGQDRNKSLVLKHFEEFVNRQDLAAIDRNMAEDFV